MLCQLETHLDGSNTDTNTNQTRNLAQNQLDSIGATTTTSRNSSLDLDLNFAQSNQLISLSVRQNPLGHLQAGCFRRLSRLKTL